MGGAPPLPHNFAPEGAKNRKKLCDFGPPEAGGPLAREGRRTWVREPRRARLGRAAAPAEAWDDPGTPALRGAAGEMRDQSVADSGLCQVSCVSPWRQGVVLRWSERDNSESTCYLTETRARLGVTLSHSERSGYDGGAGWTLLL